MSKQRKNCRGAISFILPVSQLTENIVYKMHITLFSVLSTPVILAEIIAETYQGVSFTRVRWDLLYYAIISKSPEAGFGWEYVGI